MKGIAVFESQEAFVAASVVYDRQGRIYLGGQATSTVNFTPVIVRLLEGGSVDPSFGTAGMGRYDVASLGTGSIAALVITPDDFVIAVGNTATDASVDSVLTNDCFALRIRADGVLDPAFGQGGWIRWDWGYGQSNMLRRALLRSDGRLAACGHSFLASLLEGQRASVVQLTPAGNFDAAAAGAGRSLLMHLANSECTAMTEDSKRRLVLGGSMNPMRAFVARTAN